MRKYSQNNEQSVIIHYFKNFTGTFLDLGSYNGVELSNVRALTELGWDGVMVEASPTVYKELKKNYADYPNIQLCNCAVGAATGMLEFHDNHNALGTLHPDERERWKGTQAFKMIEVPCMEINELLRHCYYKTFDFISCDIEGEDLNVIRRLNFDTLKTKMICVEFNSKDKHLYNEVIEPYGFKLIHANGENLIYYRN